jgi:hypothetical protein
MLNVTNKPIMLSVVMLNGALLQCYKFQSLLARMFIPKPESAKSNRREPRSCLGQVFNCKFGKLVSKYGSHTEPFKVVILGPGLALVCSP